MTYSLMWLIDKYGTYTKIVTCDPSWENQDSEWQAKSTGSHLGFIEPQETERELRL